MYSNVRALSVKGTLSHYLLAQVCCAGNHDNPVWPEWFDIRYTRLENRYTDTQATAGYIGSYFVMLFRHTEFKWRDLVIDMLALKFPSPFHSDPSARVHMGFLMAYLSVKDAVINVLRNEMCSRVVFVGHSLGGALAQLAAEHTSYTTAYRPYCVTFGSARVGNRSYVSRSYTSPVNYINRLDIIPYLQVLSCINGKVINLPTVGHSMESYVKGVKGLFE